MASNVILCSVPFFQFHSAPPGHDTSVRCGLFAWNHSAGHHIVALDVWADLVPRLGYRFSVCICLVDGSWVVCRV